MSNYRGHFYPGVTFAFQDLLDVLSSILEHCFLMELNKQKIMVHFLLELKKLITEC